jgi:hypothetical protein
MFCCCSRYANTHGRLLKEILLALNIPTPESAEHLLNSPGLEDREDRDREDMMSDCSGHSSAWDSISTYPGDELPNNGHLVRQHSQHSANDSRSQFSASHHGSQR